MCTTMVEGRLSFRVDPEAGAEFGWKFDQLALGACDAVHGKEEADVEEEELRRRNGSWLGSICRGGGREEGKGCVAGTPMREELS